MKCTSVQLPGGVSAIVCGPTPRARRCSSCGCHTPAAEQRECDWKIREGKTCDRLICVGCSHVPAPGKDLCPEHAALWKARAVADGGGIK